MFALCADDFAMNEPVSRGVLNLVDAGRLTAVSAMATGPQWAEMARELAERRGRVAIGLHLDLTHRPFDGRRPAYGLSELISASLRASVELTALRAEFERQFDLFETALGFPPDHVDGHHHVHALPQVRTAVFDVLARRFLPLPRDYRPLARDPGDSLFRVLRRRGARAKALTVAALSVGFARRAGAAGFATNIGFAGFSRFSGEKGYTEEFAEFLAAPGPRHLVMCHPGLDGGAVHADLAARRREEYECLMASAILPHALLKIQRGSGERRAAFAEWLHGREMASRSG
jgi:hypothetical protein